MAAVGDMYPPRAQPGQHHKHHHLMEKSLGHCEQMRTSPANGPAPSISSFSGTSHSQTGAPKPTAITAPTPISITAVAAANTAFAATTTSTARQPRPTRVMASQRSNFMTAEQWKNTKLILRLVDIVFCVVALVLAGALERLMSLGITIITVGPAAGAAIMWNVAELATLVFTKGRHGIVPGAHVAMHLLICLAWVVFMVLLPLVIFTYDETYDYLYWRPYGADSVIWALIIFVSMTMISQISLFVMSCCDEHCRRRDKRAVLAALPRYSEVVPAGGVIATAGAPRKPSFEEL